MIAVFLLFRRLFFSLLINCDSQMVREGSRRRKREFNGNQHVDKAKKICVDSGEERCASSQSVGDTAACWSNMFHLQCKHCILHRVASRHPGNQLMISQCQKYLIPYKSVESDLRTISLTTVLGKLLESFVFRWLFNHIKPSIDPLQFGNMKIAPPHTPLST